MSITSQSELAGMQKVSSAVGLTLKKMRAYAKVGMHTAELDEYGAKLLQEFGAKSAPKFTYGFPGWTCISVNEEVAHGIPSTSRVLKDGDLVNIDVSAELEGYWADNGSSFVLGNDIHEHSKLVNASQKILLKAISRVKSGVRIADIGRLIELEARKSGYKVIRNLAGHGVGRSLHEAPYEILNCYDAHNRERFKKDTVVAVETFIATRSNWAREMPDGWTLKGNRGGFVAQHEHTIVVKDGKPLILTQANGISAAG